VVDGASLRVDAGQLVTLVGVNGAGKTTLLRLVCGLLAPDAGTIRVAGVTPRDRRTFQSRLAYLSAGNAGLYGRLTVVQHLELVARLAFVPRSDRAARQERVVAAFDLEPFLRRRVDRLSLGQRQRVRLALAFLPRTALVLLDEPRTSLDEAGDAVLMAAVATHRGDGGGVLWCAPRAEVDRPDAAYVISDGAVAAA